MSAISDVPATSITSNVVWFVAMSHQISDKAGHAISNGHTDSDGNTHHSGDCSQPTRGVGKVLMNRIRFIFTLIGRMFMKGTVSHDFLMLCLMRDLWFAEA